MEMPDWVGKLTNKQAKLREVHGLWPGRDGWYKTVGGRKRYVAKRIPFDEVCSILPHRVDELLGRVEARSTTLATASTSIKELAEMYLAHLWHRVQTGQPRKMSARTFADYKKVLPLFLSSVGPSQPAIAANPTWFSHFARRIAHRAETSRNRIYIYIAAFFSWAGPGRHSLNFYKTPVSFGPDFVKPGDDAMMASLENYEVNYTPAQFKAALQAVAPSPMLFAVGLLALNAAFIPVDIVNIPLRLIDLDAGEHNFPRGKNRNKRRAVLMPETIAAIRRYMQLERPPVKSLDEPLFIRADGRRYSDDEGKARDDNLGTVNTISRYWSDCTGMQLKGLRTTFGTEADAEDDSSAVDLVMGHGKKTTRKKHYVKRSEVDRMRQRLHDVIAPVWQRFGDQEFPPVGASISAFALADRLRRAAACATSESASTARR